MRRRRLIRISYSLVSCSSFFFSLSFSFSHGKERRMDESDCGSTCTERERQRKMKGGIREKEGRRTTDSVACEQQVHDLFMKTVASPTSFLPPLSLHLVPLSISFFIDDRPPSSMILVSTLFRVLSS